MHTNFAGRVLLGFVENENAKWGVKKRRAIALPIFFRFLNLLQDSRAEGRVRAKWAATLQGLGELISLAKVL